MRAPVIDRNRRVPTAALGPDLATTAQAPAFDGSSSSIGFAVGADTVLRAFAG
jgi:hypothetical protein